MLTFPEDIQFIYPWRSYQKRVLDELSTHLDDDHLHIIAPPGSGKTVLGLEVALQLNQPTLILAPTVAIRNQWADRFCELFLQQKQRPHWISLNINEPAFLTISTYQGLHAACTDIDNEEAGRIKQEKLLRKLRKARIKTIVVDEAHHLKNAWWVSLQGVKDELQPTIVGLTATPPYDVSIQEWNRYIELNGTPDTEISIPELVKEGDLCPHQDLVYLTFPSKDEFSQIKRHYEQANQLFEELQTDIVLQDAFLTHPAFTDPFQKEDWIYDNIEKYSAILIFLNQLEVKINKKHLQLIGDKKIKIPELNYHWFEILLTFYLYNDEHFEKYSEHRNKLKHRLKQHGLIERKSISFRKNRTINRFLNNSISKLKGIEDIVRFEANQLQNNLQLVILSDYIRKEFLASGPQNEVVLRKLGVIPIFEQLRRAKLENRKIGVLTGSLVIIPSNVKAAFLEKCKERGLLKVDVKPLPYDSEFLIIEPSQSVKAFLVEIITELFENGNLQILIGTKALLGEGWDAPSMNALILASFIGSYVSSNQMRGRAIRSQLNHPNKTSNIWHLASVDPLFENGGPDIDLLKRRCKAFVGISHRVENRIESGLERLTLPKNFSDKKEISGYNKKMFDLAKDREKLTNKWSLALEEGNLVIHKMSIPFDGDYNAVKSLYYNKTIVSVFKVLLSLVFVFSEVAIELIIKNARTIESFGQLITFLVFLGFVGLIIFGRQLIKAITLYVKYRDIAKDLHGIAEALTLTLSKMELIKTDYSELSVETELDDLGGISCSLYGATRQEQSTFLKALYETISKVENPRFLMIRKSKLFNLLSQKDFHTVPSLIGKNKSQAESFASFWRAKVGRCELIYTKSLEGRKILLKSRMQSLASKIDNEIETTSQWM